ncbi:hypothetical protein V4C53_03770 [Paraburkholderia azotifigens]|uniref:hypothetical protein n=1 Tax=Paraburkholderia azotifigens TaxID=2057004 RepID=UPI0031755B16
MNNLRIQWIAVTLVFVGLFVAVNCSATELSPGGSVELHGATAASSPSLKGTVLADRIIDFQLRDQEGKLVFIGTLQDRVVRSSKTGKLCFYHRIRSMEPRLSGAIASVVKSGYAHFRADVDYRLDGLGAIPPVLATRSESGEQIRFIFARGKGDYPGPEGQPIGAGDESRFFFIQTDDRGYELNGNTTIFGTDGSHLTLRTFAPR